jgi:hypothetical protein
MNEPVEYYPHGPNVDGWVCRCTVLDDLWCKVPDRASFGVVNVDVMAHATDAKIDDFECFGETSIIKL